MPKLKVSIITVVFNNAKTIAKCIESVLAQDYDNIEYIVVDGSSTDGTQNIIERYSDSISVYISEKDGGIYDAMNKGLSLVNGDVIAFLNSDDYYFPNAVSASVRNLQENDCDLSYAGFYYANEAGYAEIADEARPWNETLLLQGIPGGHETIFAKRHVYDAIGGFDLQYRLAADYQWVTRVFKGGFKACGMARTILVMAPGGASFNESLEHSENKRILEESFGPLSPELFERLYNLKFYRNWHGRVYDDKQAIRLIDEARAHSADLARVVTRVVELRKIHLRGNIRPACDPHMVGRRILVVVNFLSGVNGGAERIAVEQANELHASGYLVTVLSCSAVAGQPYYPLHPDIPHIDLAISPYKWHYERRQHELHADFGMWAHLEFPRLDYSPTEADFQNWLNSGHLWRARMYASFLIEHEFDIVLAHMPSSYPYVCLLDHHIRAARPNLRVISILHNSPTFKFYSDDYPADSKMDRFMRLATLHASDRIGILFEEFRGQMPVELQARCVVMPNFTTHKVRHIDAEGRQKRIMAVGRLVPQKDHATLLRAYAKLRKLHPDWDLQIYGDGPLRPALNELATDLGLDPDEIFQGSRRGIDRYYETASIFAFPSSFEGFGLVLVEAMAAGLPAVGFSDCEGVKYIIEHERNGLLAEGGGDRVEAMFEALRRLIETPEDLRRMSRNAPERAGAFSLSAAINILKGIIRNTMSTQTAALRRPDRAVPARPLRTLILASYTTGGAGIAAMRLHRALLAAGHDSWVLSFSSSDDERVYTTGLSAEEYCVETSLHPILAPSNRKPLSTLFSPGLSGVSQDHFAFFEQFDVINIHWVAGMIRYDLIERLAELGKPIVWTLHDMNPFTGGCHYSDGCLGYRSNCRDCPQLLDTFGDIPEAIRAMKAGSWPHSMTVVSPSHWLTHQASTSSVFRWCRTTTIANSIDLDVFRPIDKAAARASFGLPKDKKILLFSSLDNNERRKGFPELIRTAEILAERGHDFHIVALGQPNQEIAALKLGYTAVGFLSAQSDIARLIAAADVTVLPTLEDNLPNVILESVACGTPVAAFAAGGVRDAVVSGISGALAPVGDIEALADGIAKLFQSDLSATCRRFAEFHFAPDWQARAYEALYTDLLLPPARCSEPRQNSYLFDVMEHKQQMMARSLRIAQQDIDFLKRLCDDFRAEIAGLHNGLPRPEAARAGEVVPLPERSINVTEERFFGEDGFINIRVASQTHADPFVTHFYLKLWSRFDGVVMELRENDGALARIADLDSLEVGEDEYGRVIYAKLLAPDLSDGPDLATFAAMLQNDLRDLPAALRRASLSRGDKWNAIAERLQAGGLAIQT